MSPQSPSPQNPSCSRSTAALSQGIRFKLLQFRRRVRLNKFTETVFTCSIALLFAYLLVFGAERLTDTKLWIRASVLMSLMVFLGLYGPWMWRRWFWNTRLLTQVARLFRFNLPRLSEQVVSVVELVGAKDEQQRSPQLVAAAMKQVENRLQVTDLMEFVPSTPWRRLIAGLAFVVVLTGCAASLAPSAALNSLARLFLPWQQVERYTFARLQPLPNPIVVPIGEPFSLPVAIDGQSKWKPATARLQAGSVHLTTERDLNGSNYLFSVPGMIDSSDLTVYAGDTYQRSRIIPMVRPDAIDLTANIKLPAYLKYANDLQLDARTGSIDAPLGSQIQIAGQVNRPLSLATLRAEHEDSALINIENDRFHSNWIDHQQSQEIQLGWRDSFGMDSLAPRTLKLRVVQDRLPTVRCEGLTHHSVWLASDTLRFDISGEDDFGLARMGIQWRIPNSSSGLKENVGGNEPKVSTGGERTVISGDPQIKSLNGQATFNCEAEKMEPQIIELRVYAEDFRGAEGRTYSVPYLIKFMSSAEHADWIAQQLRQWKGKLDSSYDEELRLLDANREVRESLGSVNPGDNLQKKLRQQAADERANAERLQKTVEEGQKLLEQALRNEEVRSKQIEEWARALQRLNQLAESSMPKVSAQLDQSAKNAEDLLSESSDSKQTAQQDSMNLSRPEKSQDKAKLDSQEASSGGGGSLPETHLKDPENSMQEMPSEKGKEKEKKGKAAKEDLDKAVADQTKNVEEFRKARDAFGELMSELENSTFVKRLKAASQTQRLLAAQVNSMIAQTFGRRAEDLTSSEREEPSSLKAAMELAYQSYEKIQRDLESYQRELPAPARESVLGDMKDLDAIDKLREMPLRLDRNLRGDTLHRLEYWSDTLDRWAEELAGPGGGNKASGEDEEKPRDKLPPALLLEILRIIYDEMDLREETRTLGQWKATDELQREEQQERGDAQAIQQLFVQQRTLNAVQDIKAIPNGAKKFKEELQKLNKAVQHMDDASAMLADGNVNDEVVAAQTAAIEALIETKRGKGGSGGGGDSAGGSLAGGSTHRSPLDLVGPGSDRAGKALPRTNAHGLGKAGRQLPEEYREGLDTFLNKLNQKRGQP